MTSGRQQFDENLQQRKKWPGSDDDPSAYLLRSHDPREQSGEQQQEQVSPEENNRGYYPEQEYAYSEAQREREKLTPRPQRKKSRGSRLWIGLAGCLLVLFLMGGLFFSVRSGSKSMSEQAQSSMPSSSMPMMKQTVYNVGSTPTLTVHSTDMQVSIQAANVDTVTVATTGAGVFNTVQNGTALMLNQVGFVDKHSDETLMITVPRNAAINIVSTDASVEVGQTTGKLNISTTNGSINVNGATLQDSSTLNSTNGSITFGGSFAPGGKYHIESVQGDIAVTTPPGAPIHITASTVNGHIENSLGANSSTNDPLAPDVQLHSVDGTIRVDRG